MKASDEAMLDTDRIQRALDGCVPGKAVELETDGARSAFLSGPLRIPDGIALRIDAGAVLTASRDPWLYDVRSGSCGLVDDQPEGCSPLISVHHAPQAVHYDNPGSRTDLYSEFGPSNCGTCGSLAADASAWWDSMPRTLLS